MPASADVVIVGGGVIGLWIAHHLARRGVGEVLVIERGQCGEGATLKATGGIRVQFASPLNVRLSLLALPAWRSFDEAFAARATFTQRGYLFLATTPAQVAAGQRDVVMQRALGAPTRLVTPAEAAHLAPGLNLDGVLGGTYGPWDGSIEVAEVVRGLVDGVRRQGVTLWEGATVTGLTVTGNRLTAVTTTAGVVATSVVVNAAGPWAAAVGALAGLDLPVRAERRQAALTTPGAGLDPAAAWTIDLGSGCYARPAADGAAVIGGGDRAAAADLPPNEIDAPGLAELRTQVGRRFPALAGRPLARAWAGPRPMAPDDHVILGPTAVTGVIAACGAGGQGLMHAPAIGQLVAELIVDGAASSLDIAPFSPDRFARGALLTGPALF